MLGDLPMQEQVHDANLENRGPVDVLMIPEVQLEANEEVAADNVQNEIVAVAEGDIAAVVEEGNMNIDNFELPDFLPAIQAQQTDLFPDA
jgi:hypothetical protein